MLVTLGLIMGLLVYKPGSRKIGLYRESIKRQLNLVNWEKKVLREVLLENTMVKVAGEWLVEEKSAQPLSVYKSFENSLICWIRGYPALNLFQQLEVLRLYMEARRSDSTLGRSLELRMPSHLGKVNLRFPWKVILPLLNHLIDKADRGSNLIVEFEDDAYSIHIYIKDDGESHDKGQIAGIDVPNKYNISGMQEALAHFDAFYGNNGQRMWLCNRYDEYTLLLKLNKNSAIEK
jgi:hypothetical protein